MDFDQTISLIGLTLAPIVLTVVILIGTGVITF